MDTTTASTGNNTLSGYSGPKLIVLRVIGVAILATTLFGACSPCGNDIERELQSGSGKRAVVFQRDCGATTGFTTQVSILATRAALRNESGNAVVLGGKRAIEELRWETPTKLSIRIKPDARVFLKEPRVEGVEIVYPKSDPGPIADCYVVHAGPSEAIPRDQSRQWFSTYTVALPTKKVHQKFWIEPSVENQWSEEGRWYSMELSGDVGTGLQGDAHRIWRKDIRFVRRLDVVPEGDDGLHYACRQP